MKSICIFIVLVLLVNGCAFHYSKPISNGLNSGKIEMDMKTDTVRKNAGIPDQISIRKISETDTRQVWRYREHDPSIGMLFLGIFTFGILWLIPSPSNDRYLVFRNDKLIGVDLADPTAPNLIVEKRER